MSAFLVLKIVHVLLAVVAVGANVTYAFWLRRAGTDREQLTFAIDGVRWLDRRIANPAYILLLITGIAMVATGAYSFSDRWLQVAIVLYVATALLGIFAFGPAIRRQATEAARDPTSAEYLASARRTNLFGLLTVAIVVVIVILMVAKPF